MDPMGKEQSHFQVNHVSFRMGNSLKGNPGLGGLGAGDI